MKKDASEIQSDHQALISSIRAPTDCILQHDLSLEVFFGTCRRRIPWCRSPPSQNLPPKNQFAERHGASPQGLKSHHLAERGEQIRETQKAMSMARQDALWATPQVGRSKELEEWIISTRRLLHENPELSFEVRGIKHKSVDLSSSNLSPARLDERNTTRAL